MYVLPMAALLILGTREHRKRQSQYTSQSNSSHLAVIDWQREGGSSVIFFVE